MRSKLFVGPRKCRAGEHEIFREFLVHVQIEILQMIPTLTRGSMIVVIIFPNVRSLRLNGTVGVGLSQGLASDTTSGGGCGWDVRSCVNGTRCPRRRELGHIGWAAISAGALWAWASYIAGQIVQGLCELCIRVFIVSFGLVLTCTCCAIGPG